MEGVSLIDISSEDDLLIPSSWQEFENYYYFNCPESDTASTLEAEYKERVSKQMVQALEFSESPQQKHRRSDRFSMRKSLAWDSEFFTSEGVLNPEELAIINCTYNKAGGIMLPGIDEELSKSTESTSTLNSGSCALENLEVHLFQNLKASIQKSLVDSTQTAKKLLSNKTKGQRKPDVPRMKTLKKLDVASQMMLKRSTTLKRHGNTRRQQESTSNDSIVGVKLAASGCCEAKTSGKPLKFSPKTIPSPAVPGNSGYSVTKQKKSNRAKAFTGTTAKRQPIPTLSKSDNDQGITCMSIPSKASSSCTPRADILVAASCSSSTGLASSPSDSKSLSSLENTGNVERNITHTSSRKAPARTNRSRPGSTEGSSLSKPAKSTLKLSNISPASSTNIFPKVSSSQKSTTKLWSSKSLKASDGELSSSSSRAVSYGNCVSQKSGALSQSFAGNHSKIKLKFDADTKDATSLGLRMPRPRIGYFDKEKTPVRRSDKYIQTSLQKSDVKNTGNNETAAATKRKHSNPPFIRAGAHLYASINRTSKSAEVQILHKDVDKHQELSPKVKIEASLKSAKGTRLNFKEANVAAVRAESKRSCSPSKKEQPNLLQPKQVAMANETHPNAEQRIDDQSCVMLHTQREHVEGGLNVAARSTEKENLCPASKAGYESKAPPTEDEHKVSVAMLENMVSSLSLYEVKDVIDMD